MYRLNFANEKELNFTVTASGGGHKGSLNIELCSTGAIEIYASGGTYRNDYGYDTSDDVMIVIESQYAPDFICALQVWIEQLEAPESECEGHPAGPHDPMGETVYCDGSCAGPAS